MRAAGKRRMTRKLIHVAFDFPVDIEHGKTGLIYISSPLVRGLLIGARTEEEALRQVPDVLAKLSRATMLPVNPGPGEPEREAGARSSEGRGQEEGEGRPRPE